MKLPKKVFIVREDEGTDDEFLSATTDLDSVAVMGDKRTVGIYELVEIKIAVNKTELVTK